VEFWIVRPSKGGVFERMTLMLAGIDKSGYDLGPVVHLHFLEDIVEMRLDGRFADVQFIRDAFIGQAKKEVVDDFLLPFRKGALQLRELRVQVRDDWQGAPYKFIKQLPFSPYISRMNGPDRLYQLI
jgi:hypothetical protein